MVVRSAAEILSTLDSDGALDGLPFMPEMLEWCGKAFRVERRAEKTCVAARPPEYGNRRFSGRDVVFLDGPRCDGTHHDGCKRGCKIFWKEAWLDRANPLEQMSSSAEEAKAGAQLKTKSDDTHYFCQSTQLHAATEPFPPRRKLWILRIALVEIHNGDRSAAEMGVLFARWCRFKVLRLVKGDGWLRGARARTPSPALGLMPGEVVRIKSEREIQATLDRKRANRGLGVCAEMTRYFGRQATVLERVDRLIDEETGEMREIRETVSLNVAQAGRGGSDAECLCIDQLGDCPRGELMYWREVWLERTTGGDEQGTRRTIIA